MIHTPVSLIRYSCSYQGLLGVTRGENGGVVSSDKSGGSSASIIACSKKVVDISMI